MHVAGEPDGGQSALLCHAGACSFPLTHYRSLALQCNPVGQLCFGLRCFERDRQCLTPLSGRSHACMGAPGHSPVHPCKPAKCAMATSQGCSLHLTSVLFTWYCYVAVTAAFSPACSLCACAASKSKPVTASASVARMVCRNELHRGSVFDE